MTQRTVSSFDPELLQLLLSGAREDIRIHSLSWNDAQTLRARLHALRAAMRREKHESLTVAERVHVGASRMTGEHSIVTLRPVDRALLAKVKASLAADRETPN